jgi:hypothetical protein
MMENEVIRIRMGEPIIINSLRSTDLKLTVPVDQTLECGHLVDIQFFQIN